MMEGQITDKQREFLSSLLFGRVVPNGMPVPEDLGELTKFEASEMITVLKDQPMKPITIGVPDGRYALPQGSRDGNVVYHFYLVKTTRDERKQQYILRLHGAPGDFRRAKMTRPDQVKVATILREDPAVYSMLFGKQVGSCGVCGSPLTDPQSIALGIGPICLQKQGWWGE